MEPSPSALRKLLSICGTANLLKSNPDNTQCIRFSTKRVNVLCSFMLCGKSILCCKSLVHLSHILTVDLKDDRMDVSSGDLR